MLCTAHLTPTLVLAAKEWYKKIRLTFAVETVTFVALKKKAIV